MSATDGTVSTAPVEGKVWASTAGGVGGSITAGLILWLLGVLVWHQPGDAPHAVQAVDAVPTPVALFLGLVLSAGATFAAGYRAKHSPRTVDLPAVTGELVAGRDLSVVAAALAELRAIVNRPVTVTLDGVPIATVRQTAAAPPPTPDYDSPADPAAQGAPFPSTSPGATA